METTIWRCTPQNIKHTLIDLLSRECKWCIYLPQKPNFMISCACGAGYIHDSSPKEPHTKNILVTVGLI
jgi:hypothetical protein